MENSPARDRMIFEFDAIVSKLGGTGASERAAQAILEELKEARYPDRPGGLPSSQRSGEPGETAAPWKTRSRSRTSPECYRMPSPNGPATSRFVIVLRTRSQKARA